MQNAGGILRQGYRYLYRLKLAAKARVHGPLAAEHRLLPLADGGHFTSHSLAVSVGLACIQLQYGIAVVRVAVNDLLHPTGQILIRFCHTLLQSL